MPSMSSGFGEEGQIEMDSSNTEGGEGWPGSQGPSSLPPGPPDATAGQMHDQGTS